MNHDIGSRLVYYKMNDIVESNFCKQGSGENV